MTIGDAPVRVALLGCGVVGSQVARILVEQADDLAERVGRPLELVGIGVRRTIPRPGIDPALLTTDVPALVRREDVDVVIVQTDHAEYHDLTAADLPGVTAIVDGRRALNRDVLPQAQGPAHLPDHGLESAGHALASAYS